MIKDTVSNGRDKGVDEVVVDRSRTSARGVILSGIVVLLSMMLVLVPGLPSACRVGGSSGLMVGVVSAVIFCGKLSSKGQEPVGGILLWAGLVAIWLSTAFDIGVTMVCSPDLAREGNPFLRVVRDQGLSMVAVYTYVLVIVVGSCAFLSLCWAAVCRHRGPWLRKAAVESSGSAIGFCKAAAGGGGLSWRQFLLPLHCSELPRAYGTALTSCASCVVFLVLAHTRAGLEWIGAIPHVRLWYLGLEVPAGIALLLALAFRAYRRGKRHQPGQANARPG